MPPPVIAAVIFGLMWPLSHALPRVNALGSTRIPIAIGIALLGLVFDAVGAWAFRRAQTTVNPLRPEKTAVLVTTGVYRITRNPMYVGIMFVLLAWAAFLASPVSLTGPVAFIAYMTRFQIRPEERILLGKFGGEYQQYRAKVRRWI
jgi:protein-S-isoprenylcysteine O-methyltransferase Ste14